MSRSPRITGSELIAALAKDGFQVVRVRGSITFFVMKTAGVPSCPCTRMKRWGPGC